ncbi:hypothetical protein SAMN04487969_114143 [Paenibacillus algorifonticola]|uniref:Uncharacterized protein n=1 Tax=Paenibacillus algorifonticola TaxID=684063 RepID=A0A1I2G569_9BACL|nr:hypothetical protein [Paenibacillus algorifonticola]SFF12130.1 hypothetical protein SAMN04487969_114143 [Paenibacillus algorifonticola]
MNMTIEVNNDVRSRNYRWNIFVLIFALFIAGCSGNNKNTEERRENHAGAQVSPVGQGVPQEKDNLLEQYRQTVQNAKEPFEIVSFLNENMSKAGQERADTMIRELNAYYNNDLERTQDAFFEKNVQEVLLQQQWPITASNAAEIQDAAVKQLVITKLMGGYKLIMVEGSIYPIIDFELQKVYKNYVSQQMNDYIFLRAVESNEVSAKDAGLIITWDKLANRAVLSETYIKTYPNSAERPEIEQLYLNSYLSMYIYGLNNTPIFDMETYRLLSEVKTSYQKLVKEHPETVTAKIVSQFLDVLATTDEQVYNRINGQQMDIPAVKQFHERFQAKAEELLGG